MKHNVSPIALAVGFNIVINPPCPGIGWNETLALIVPGGGFFYVFRL